MNRVPIGVCQHTNGGHRLTLSHWSKFNFHICRLDFVSAAQLVFNVRLQH